MMIVLVYFEAAVKYHEILDIWFFNHFNNKQVLIRLISVIR